MAARVLAARFDNVRDDAFEIVSNVRGPDSDRSDSLPIEPGVSSLVALRIRAKLVRQSIHFNGKRDLKTVEVEKIGSVFMLLPEFEALGSLFERSPKPAFRRRH